MKQTHLRNALMVAIVLVILSAGLVGINTEVERPVVVDDSSLAVSAVESPDCIEHETELLVSGYSMAGLLEDGDKATAAFGFYDCMPVKRDDWVLYRLGEKRSYVKVVKGLYPDSFSIEALPEGKGWQIRLNGEMLTTSTGQPYRLESHKGLQLRDEAVLYRGRIPRGKFLIMGNQPEGTHDSSWYGLVSRDLLLAKIKL